MKEMATSPKHNILTERDFSHLDFKPKEKPQIDSIAMSSVVYYPNKKDSNSLKNFLKRKNER